MKSKSIIGLFIAFQLVSISGAVAQDNDQSNKAATTQEIQALQAKSDHSDDLAVREFSAGVATLVVTAFTHFGYFGEGVPLGFKLAYTAGGLLSAKGLVDSYIGDHYDARAKSLSLSKNIPAETTGCPAQVQAKVPGPAN